MNPSFVSGALFMGSLVAGLLFLKFHVRSREVLFLWFGVGFALMAIERVLIGNVVTGPEDFGSAVYLLRLCAFLCIAGGIVAKNRSASERPGHRDPPPPRNLRPPDADPRGRAESLARR